uniref:Uncharacterized protein n=1 Tax=Neobodo designis TaxID=312471 RepID=A0A7S1LYI1_NEODS
MARVFAFLAVLLAVLAVVASAGKYEDMKQACDMCANINMGGGSKQNYVCPKDSVKECNININGWCCSKKRASAKCKPCWDLNADDDDDDEDM